MFLIVGFALIVLILTLSVQIFQCGNFEKYSKFLLLLGILGVFVLCFYYSFIQYQSWKSNPFTSFFLPPHQNWNYFIFYMIERLFAPWILAFVAAIVIIFLAKKLNSRFGEVFFEKGEINLIGLGVFLSGWPGFLFYIILILLCGALNSLAYAFKGKGRAPLYYFWLPTAIIVIIMTVWFIPKAILDFFVL